MAVRHTFSHEIDHRLDLSASEAAFFQAAGVTSCDTAHALLHASFCPGASRPGWSSEERRNSLLAGLHPHTTPRYRGALDRWNSAGRHPTGSAAPSAAAHRITAPPLLGLVQPSLSAADPIDLVGEHRYPAWLSVDQRPRQTCVAFAAIACIELARAGQGDVFTPLSAQYLYWHMRRRQWPGDPPPGWNEGATKLSYAKEVLTDHGICSARACPYVAQLPPKKPIEGPRPSRAAEAEAAASRIADIFYDDYPDPASRPPGIAKQVYGLLAQGRPVAISIPVFHLSPGSSATTLDNPQTLASGQIVDPPPGSTVTGGAAGASTPGHAVCVIGFQRDDGGGWFIFRNSYGLGFADSIDIDDTTPPLVPDRGFGAVSARYVENYCWEVFSPAI